MKLLIYTLFLAAGSTILLPVVATETGSVPVHGTCDPQFQAVKDAFVELINRDFEIGASLAVYYKGKSVVDLYGGYIDEKKTQPWKKDTIVCVMSTTKAMAATCAHILIDRGELDMDAPVAKYWPEFAQNGKENITVRQLIGHHAAMIYADAAPKGTYLDWDTMVDALAKQAPAWEPGTKGAYHSATYGYLVGELVKRVSGKTVGTFFQDEIAKPLGLDYYIGVPESELHRVTDYHYNWENLSLGMIMGRNQSPTGKKMARAWGAMPDDNGVFNSKKFRMVESPAANAHGNAGALARFYGMMAVGGEIDGIRILSKKQVEIAQTQVWEEEACGMTDRHFRMAYGYFKNTPKYMAMGPNPNSFGHQGLGGSLGFADPDYQIGFGFAANHMNSGGGIGKWREDLIYVIYDCIDSKYNSHNQ